MRSRNDSADIDTGLPRQSSKRYSPTILIVLASILFASGTAAVFAVLFPVLLSDTVSITDQPSLHSTAKDSLDPQEDPSNSQTTSDGVGHLDTASPSSSVSDDLGLSDSAQVTASMFYQVTTTSILAVSDSVSPGTSTLDALDVQDSSGLGTTLGDVIPLLDSAARELILYITDSLAIADVIATKVDHADVDEVEDRETGGHGNGPDRIVYDQSYFQDRPLSRLRTTSIDIIDSQDRVTTRVVSGQNIDISIAMRNQQKVNQGYTLFVQIVDQDDVAIDIIQTSGVIKDGAAINVNVPWTTAPPGAYTIGMLACDDSLSPTIIAEIVTKAFVIS